MFGRDLLEQLAARKVIDRPRLFRYMLLLAGFIAAILAIHELIFEIIPK